MKTEEPNGRVKSAKIFQRAIYAGIAGLFLAGAAVIMKRGVISSAAQELGTSFVSRVELEQREAAHDRKMEMLSMTMTNLMEAVQANQKAVIEYGRTRVDIVAERDRRIADLKVNQAVATSERNAIQTQLVRIEASQRDIANDIKALVKAQNGR